MPIQPRPKPSPSTQPPQPVSGPRPPPSSQDPHRTTMSSVTSDATSASQGLHPLPQRLRPLPSAPAASEAGSSHSHPSLPSLPSPPPSSYHATAGHSDHPRPSGGRTKTKEPSSSSQKYDPVWYPDRVPANDSHDDMYASEEESRAYMQGQAPPKPPRRR